MFRLFAVVLVIGAFGGTLYFAGDTLEAWESPKPEPLTMPRPTKQKHARPARHAQPAKRTVPAKPRWLVELNAACRRAKRESESMHRPSIPQELAPMVRKVIGMNARMNRETAELVSRSGKATAAAQLRSLYAQDEALLRRALNASERGQYQRLRSIGRSLLAVGIAENNLFARLGARSCTVSPDQLQL